MNEIYISKWNPCDLLFDLVTQAEINGNPRFLDMIFSNKAENSDHWSYEIFFRGSDALKQEWKNLFEVLVAAESDVRFQELVSCLSILYEVDENYIQSDFVELKKLVSIYTEPSRSNALNFTKKSGVFYDEAESFFGYSPLVNPSTQLLNSSMDTTQQTFRLGFL